MADHGDHHGHDADDHKDHGHEHLGHGHHGGERGGASVDSHAHAPTHAPTPLSAGSGRGKVLFFDAFSGIAGDMTIAALLDLGVPFSVVERAVSLLGLDGFHIHVGHAHRSGIVATTFDVHVETKQPERTYGTIVALLEKAQLEPSVRNKALAIFARLGEAESIVHRTPLSEVHFHEVGSVDAIVDIVGAAACLDWLGADVVVSPLPMGHGFVNARHGVLPLPAPATVSCLRGVPTYSVDLEAELVTPTGAAIAATVASSFTRWPSIAPERVGWGAGRRELPDRPNLLRAVLGAPTESLAPSTSIENATHVVLEANIDDMTGELAAHALEALLYAGALDAWATPIVMKKGRPGLLLSVLAPLTLAREMASVVFRETSTIGLRRTDVTRIERPRRIVEVSTRFGVIPVKVSEGAYGPPQVKAEFDACARAARAAGVPVREVIAAAMAAFSVLG